MADVGRSERTLFLDALDLPAAERSAHLDKACAGDTELRERVESLLAAHDSPQEPLARFGFDAPDDFPSPQRSRGTAPADVPFESVGDEIGPFKLLEQIGEGGFAVVFLAEQQQPVRRRVALKIIKPGMDTREVIARFDAERQALAMMDHPNIAKVLSAGATDSGRPYFVMELVQGVPITAYCDQCNLFTRERLELFVKVCQAVQHAHQKGVIHRDIKPTNVLVAMQDGRPAPKVIDFGIAKAIHQPLTEHTLATGFSQILGTPLYMSPEQAELSPLGVDTRSDIYSLGVLLYELLVGATPFDKERLQASPYASLHQIICEVDPLPPSARLSTLAADLATTVAEHRRTDRRRLLLAVRGDLDWIVMRCLEKDRNRRYETANGLARDIQRYLHDEPVHACPPSSAYRFRKFAKRNKLALASGSAIVAALLLLVAGLAVSNRVISAERNEKEQALEEKEQALTQAEAERQRAEKNFRRARIAVRGILSDAARGIGDWSKLSPAMRKRFAQESVNFYENLLQEASDDPSLQYETAVGYRSLSTIYNSIGDREKSDELMRQSIAILERLSTAHPEVASYRHQLAYNLYALGWRLTLQKQGANAPAALQKSIALYAQLIADDPEHGSYYLERTACCRVLIHMLDEQGNAAAAAESVEKLVSLLHQAAHHSPSVSDMQMFWRLELLPKVPFGAPLAPDVPMGIAQTLVDLGRLEEALNAGREIVEGNPDNVAARYNLALLLEKNMEYDAAIEQLERALLAEPEHADSHSLLAWLRSGVSNSAFHDPQQAIRQASRAVERAPEHGPFWNMLGVAQYRAGDFEAARAALKKSLAIDANDALAMVFLSMAQWQLGNHEQALKSYHQVVEWMDEHKPNDASLLRFRREAAELLGVEDS